MNKKLLWCLAILLLFSCATNRNIIQEEMLVDGITWRVHILFTEKCKSKEAEKLRKNTSFLDQFSSDNKSKIIDVEVNECINKLKPKAQDRGRELCGVEANRVFGCSIGKKVNPTTDGQEGSFLSCYVECKKKY